MVPNVIHREARGWPGPCGRILLAAVLCSAVCTWLPKLAVAGEAHIGYIYKLEGHLNGQRVVHVGSTAKSLKIRLGNHKWTQLLRQTTTEVSFKKVYAELDVIGASNKEMVDEARRQALRSVEQVDLDETRKEYDDKNRQRQPGQKRAKVLSEKQASSDAETWQKRHKARADEKWTKLRESVSPRGAAKLRKSASPRGAVTLRAAGGMLLLTEAYRLYYDYKVSRFVKAPYVLEDEHGVFTLYYSKRSWGSDTKYFKDYVAGTKKGEKVRVSESEFEDLAEEAKALWGTIDWQGDFVPGLLMPSLDGDPGPRLMAARAESGLGQSARCYTGNDGPPEPGLCSNAEHRQVTYHGSARGIGMASAGAGGSGELSRRTSGSVHRRSRRARRARRARSSPLPADRLPASGRARRLATGPAAGRRRAAAARWRSRPDAPGEWLRSPAGRRPASRCAARGRDMGRGAGPYAGRPHTASDHGARR